MIVAEQDQSQPANLSRDAFERIGQPKKLVTVAAGHTALLEQKDNVAQAASAAIDWFKQYLA
jgi:pimeloyl-ACP methyl ester carboxylesterase